MSARSIHGEHMVDRPGVQAQQCVQLTGTNITYAFYVVFCFCYLFPIALGNSIYIQKFGDHSGRDTPGHISNPAVKSACAYDTWIRPGKIGSRQTFFLLRVSVAQPVRASDC